MADGTETRDADGDDPLLVEIQVVPADKMISAGIDSTLLRSKVRDVIQKVNHAIKDHNINVGTNVVIVELPAEFVDVKMPTPDVQKIVYAKTIQLVRDAGYAVKIYWQTATDGLTHYYIIVMWEAKIDVRYTDAMGAVINEARISQEAFEEIVRSAPEFAALAPRGDIRRGSTKTASARQGPGR